MKNITRLLAACCTLGLLHGQGDLTPPLGAPAPGMKTLSQIEPRTPLEGGPVNHIISSPGSYYLTGNLTQSGANSAVTINVENVTLDLNGFSVIGNGSGTNLSGIQFNFAAKNSVITNGTIKGWSGSGLSVAASCLVERISSSGNGTNGILASANSIVRNCVVSGNTATGIYTGNQCLVDSCSVSGSIRGFQIAERSTIQKCNISGSSEYGVYGQAGCTVSDTTVSGVTAGSGIRVAEGGFVKSCSVTNCVGSGNYGIIVFGSSKVDQCVVTACTVVFGIYAGDNSSVNQCVASGNTSAQSTSFGISVGTNSSVNDCTASQNTSTAGTLSETTGGGIQIGGSNGNSSVNRCTASQNKGAGISAGAQSAVVGNHCAGNGFSGGTGPGIFCNNVGVRVEGNNVSFNTFGIKATSVGCIILRNTSRANSWSIVAGCSVAPMITTVTSVAISGSTGGTAFGSTDPTANWMY